MKPEEIISLGDKIHYVNYSSNSNNVNGVTIIRYLIFLSLKNQYKIIS